MSLTNRNGWKNKKSNMYKERTTVATNNETKTKILQTPDQDGKPIIGNCFNTVKNRLSVSDGWFKEVKN